MAAGIVFLVMVGFVIPASAVLGAVYVAYLAERRPPPGERERALPTGRAARRRVVAPAVEPGIPAPLHWEPLESPSPPREAWGRGSG